MCTKFELVLDFKDKKISFFVENSKKAVYDNVITEIMQVIKIQHDCYQSAKF